MSARCNDCGEILLDLIIIMSPTVLDVEGICVPCNNDRAKALAGSWEIEDFLLADEEECEGQLLLPRG